MGRKKIIKENYFDVNEENAVLSYITSTSQNERYKLYSKYLEKPFQIMIESILRRYPNHIGNHDIHDVELQALSHLIEQMVNFKPLSIKYRIIKEDMSDDDWITCGKFMNEADMEIEYQEFLNDRNAHLYEYKKFNNKAFSYCQTIVRNYFKDHSRKSRQDILSNQNFEDFSHIIDEKEEYQYELEFHTNDYSYEYVQGIINKIKAEIETNYLLKENEVIVGDAIIHILSNWELLFQEDDFINPNTKKVTNNYKKNKILLLLQEYTNLKTKEIRTAMKQYKDLYFIMKKDIINSL